MAHLAWPEEVDVDIGIPSDRVDAILAEVFAHVLRGGLRQQPINAFPAMTYNSVLTAATRPKQPSQMTLIESPVFRDSMVLDQGKGRGEGQGSGERC